MALPFLQIEQLTVQRSGRKILDHIDLIIRKGEIWAITGPSGSGKTTLANAICGHQHFTGRILFNGQAERLPRIEFVDQQHHFKNLSNRADFYYQQRYNASDAENTITVAEALSVHLQSGSASSSPFPANQIPALLHIDHLLHEPLIQLSNGENKRLQIAKAILRDPQLLILDNPFIGLDTDGRSMLSTIISRLSAAGIGIILTTSSSEIPDCITHIALLENGKLLGRYEKKEFTDGVKTPAPIPLINQHLLHSLRQPTESDFEYAVRMVNVTISYGDRMILSNINWEVKKGVHWSISGPNGAGKSTLLSLITGDNTKAYANEIYLFDKRRGSGESIWDIKKKIGYVSPEMHVYFDYSATCFETVASGLFDSIGLFRTLNNAQQEQIKQWITLFRLESVQNKPLSLLSAGEQRLALLARALVKNPPLLILDEPCQGLDGEHIQQFRKIVNTICKTFDTTLLYVSHYQEEIPECVNHFMRIEEGVASIRGLR